VSTDVFLFIPMKAEAIKKGGFLESLAEESGVAIVVLDKNGNERAAANNNSICGTLYSSKEFGPKCAEDCGTALANAIEAGRTIAFHCHAGLDCRAVAAKKGGRELVTIFGRTFSKAEDYRRATKRSITGDWRQFSPTAFFENVIISTSPNQLEDLERRIADHGKEILAEIAGATAEAAPRKDAPQKTVPATDVRTPDSAEPQAPSTSPDLTPATGTESPDPFESSMLNFKLESSSPADNQDLADREAWRSFIPSLLQVSYKLACRRILEFLSRHYGIESSLWLQRSGAEFETAAVFGESEDRPVRIDISIDDKRIRAAARDDSPIVLRELQTAANKKLRVIQLFPVVIGGEVRNALGITRDAIDPELSSRILKFCRYVASRLEILRLRETVAERDEQTRMLREFNDQLRNIDAESFWQGLINVSAQLVGAERASILVRGPEENLVAKGYIGAAEDISNDRDLGGRVARAILHKGQPVLVTDIALITLSPAPASRKYRSSSFISYPVVLGDSGLAVLNFTDKAGGERFDKNDLETLNSIAPQIAVAVDRMTLLEKVGEFAQLSITDPLTGLLNRRYIEARLAEEINRSGRTGEPLSCLMLDVDEFKTYNDRFGHPAGDSALRIIGSILKETVRGADVAARYGGEEFSVLLPETTSVEAAVIAERIRRRVEETEFPKRNVTVSIGVATRSEDVKTAEELIDAADQALYKAKENGRNQVLIYDPAMGSGDSVN
jgi:diguanylate cyclase (GGDEF)-like protein